MHDRLLTADESSGVCCLPVIAQAIVRKGTWKHLTALVPSFVSGTKMLFKKAVLAGVQDGSFYSLTSLLNTHEMIPCGPVIAMDSHRYVLGMPKLCADSITVYGWCLAELLGVTDVERESPPSGQ